MIKKAKNNSSKISQTHTGILVLENKKVFKGIGIGYELSLIKFVKYLVSSPVIPTILFFLSQASKC